MSWSDDTDKLLAGGPTVIVRSASVSFASGSVYPTTATNVVESATVQIFPKSGAYKKEIQGRIVENTHLIFFPATSSVSVGHRVYESGDTDYHEVMDVRDYNGHKQVYTEKVDKR
jgi:hypothetical protein